MNLPAIPSWAGVALKFAPYLFIAIATVALYVANNKIDSLKAQSKADGERISALIESREFFRKAVEQRDTALDRQSASIQALADAAKVNRDVYLAGITTARAVSADHQKAADELLSLKAPDGELAQCRAARELLEQELVK